ncbi:hypothetical protein Glove_130g190 [Diversispora epigaea]|uniref:Uncharacterized protein n=1 Tax=Diversispora epigaea TaxID=1348612 RepID=A0A397J730_9GLOM|nr:hypothetical protein Glove_130g190 [Diversispora epigaea]
MYLMHLKLLLKGHPIRLIGQNLHDKDSEPCHRPKFGIEDPAEIANWLLECKARSVSFKPLTEEYSEFE